MASRVDQRRAENPRLSASATARYALHRQSFAYSFHVLGVSAETARRGPHTVVLRHSSIIVYFKNQKVFMMFENKGFRMKREFKDETMFDYRFVRPTLYDFGKWI